MGNIANEVKLAEMILYVCQKCADDPCFGSIKLNKILYFADFYHYGNFGAAITGVEYQKLPHGPAPRRLLPVRNRLIEERALGIQPVALRSGDTQKRPVNLRQADLRQFSGEEIATIDEIIDCLKNLNSAEASDLSHKMVGWQLVDEGETIPYSTVFLSNEPLDDAEINRGMEIARKHGLA